MCGLCYVRPLEETAVKLGYFQVRAEQFMKWLDHVYVVIGSEQYEYLVALYERAYALRDKAKREAETIA